jgi:hypothetical protein
MKYNPDITKESLQEEAMNPYCEYTIVPQVDSLAG